MVEVLPRTGASGSVPVRAATALRRLAHRGRDCAGRLVGMTAALERLGLTACSTCGRRVGRAPSTARADRASPPRRRHVQGRSLRARSSFPPGAAGQVVIDVNYVLDYASTGSTTGAARIAWWPARCAALRRRRGRSAAAAFWACGRAPSSGSPAGVEPLPWAGAPRSSARASSTAASAPDPGRRGRRRADPRARAPTRPHRVPAPSASRIGDQLMERHLQQTNPALSLADVERIALTTVVRGHREALTRRRRRSAARARVRPPPTTVVGQARAPPRSSPPPQRTLSA